MKYAHIIIVALLLLLPIGYFAFDRDAITGGATNCTVTETKVVVGHQANTTVLAAGIKEWAIIQQRVNATNTVSLSIGGTAVSGQGYVLADLATSTGAQHELRIGTKEGIPTSDAVKAITNTGSSTVNVIVCK